MSHTPNGNVDTAAAQSTPSAQNTADPQSTAAAQVSAGYDAKQNVDQGTGKILKGRDLITTGIFFALYFILTMIPMFISGISPFIWVLFPGLAAILGSIPFMLLCARVQKPGAILIMGTVMAIICAMMGYFILAFGLFFGGALVAEAIRWATGYRSWWGNAVAFMFFSLGWMSSPLPMWLFHAQFMVKISGMGMQAEYVAACEAVAAPPFMVLCIGFTLVGAVIGVFLTRALFKKHFLKAGLA